MGQITTSRAGLTIGKVAARTGVNLETVRYYERAGLLAPPPRTRGGHRQYGDEHVKRLNFIRCGRELGFTLDEIRRCYASLRNATGLAPRPVISQPGTSSTSGARSPTCALWRKFSRK